MDILFKMLKKLGGGRGDIHMDNVHSMLLSFFIFILFTLY